jgi:hypothetical protein
MYPEPSTLQTCSEEELPELDTLIRAGAAPYKAQGGVESKQGKANVLIQVGPGDKLNKPV